MKSLEEDLAKQFDEPKNEWAGVVTIDPRVCHGKLCIRGTRIMVPVILDNLVEGLTPQEIVDEYPPLRLEDVRGAISCAATLTREEEMVPLR